MADKKLSHTIAVAQFLRTPESKNKYKLSVYEREILRVISNYLDMRDGVCYGKQKTLYFQCGMSERQFRDSCKLLIEKGLITREKQGKLYHYYLSTVTGVLCR